MHLGIFPLSAAVSVTELLLRHIFFCYLKKNMKCKFFYILSLVTSWTVWKELDLSLVSTGILLFWFLFLSIQLIQNCRFIQRIWSRPCLLSELWITWMNQVSFTVTRPAGSIQAGLPVRQVPTPPKKELIFCFNFFVVCICIDIRRTKRKRFFIWHFHLNSCKWCPPTEKMPWEIAVHL
jgi:hypothetical protein